MLKVVGSQPVTRAVNEGDIYVPLKYSFPEAGDPLPLYWRTGDLAEQLIEVGLNPRSGAVCKVTVTGLGPVHRSSGIEDGGGSDVVLGVPVCDISDWPSDLSTFASRFRDEIAPYTVFASVGSVLVSFAGASRPTRLYRCGAVDFGVSSDYLTSIRFSGMRREDLDRLLGA